MNTSFFFNGQKNSTNFSVLICSKRINLIFFTQITETKFEKKIGAFLFILCLINWKKKIFAKDREKVNKKSYIVWFISGIKIKKKIEIEKVKSYIYYNYDNQNEDRNSDLSVVFWLIKKRKKPTSKPWNIKPLEMIVK